MNAQPGDRLARDWMVRTGWRWFRLRGLALIAVFLCAFVGFQSGVDVSGRPGLPESDALVKVYYAVGLFVLGGMDLGTPLGGPLPARLLVWFAYFAAPLITVSAVIEAVIRAVTEQRWWLRRLDQHVVIAGAGRLGMLLVDRTRQLSPDVEIVLVEKRADHPNLEAVRDVYGCRVLIGDIASDALLANLRVEQAARVALTTGDDLANLDAASKILERCPRLSKHVLVHVSDLRFLHTLESTRLGRNTETFNSHQIAATHLVETKLASHFEETEGADSVVLAGFGRFGRSLLHELLERAKGHFDTVVLIDLEPERFVAEFDEEHGPVQGYGRFVVAGNAEDPAVFERALAEVRSRRPVIVLGTGDDRVNLRTALRLSKGRGGRRVIARTFDVSNVGAALAEEAGFECFAVSDLVAASLPERWRRL